MVKLPRYVLLNLLLRVPIALLVALCAIAYALDAVLLSGACSLAAALWGGSVGMTYKLFAPALNEWVGDE